MAVKGILRHHGVRVERPDTQVVKELNCNMIAKLGLINPVLKYTDWGFVP